MVGSRDVRFRKAFALGADQQRDLPADRRELGQPSPATSATVAPGSSSRPAARASGTPNTAPMLARTAFGPYGSALPGPSATHDAPKAWAERRTAPTLPGSPTPCR